MPELPEVETVCRGLVKPLKGRTIRRVQQRRAGLRFPFPANFPKKLEGRRVRGIRRRAKYILIDLDDGQTVILHLGMSGSIVVSAKKQKPEKHDHLIFETDNGKIVTFNDPRRFGLADITARADIENHRLFSHLGPEPLEKDFNAPFLFTQLQKRKSDIKAALMDQKLVAGLGNIYVCEALFLAGIHPRRRCGRVSREEASKLAAAIKKVLKKAIAAGGSSLRDYVQATGELGYFQHKWQVYDREGLPCRKCKTPLARITQSGRSSFYCPSCQK